MTINLHDQSTWPQPIDLELAKTYTGKAYCVDDYNNEMQVASFKSGRFSFSNVRNAEFDIHRSNEPCHPGYIRSLYLAMKDADIVHKLGQLLSIHRELKYHGIELNETTNL